MTIDDMDGASDQFEVLVEINMDIGAFAADWAYCDRLSSYVAKMVSHNRTDSLLYSNLLSSALNELLETAHRTHGPSGKFGCAVLRRGGKDRIQLTIPSQAEGADFYGQAVNHLSKGDLAEHYRKLLFRDGPIDPTIGLLELAVDYNAVLSVEPVGDDAIRLTAELTLEEQVQ